jgi:hypothetical protein
VHLQNSISVALAVMKSKIIASSASSVGIVFFGTVRISRISYYKAEISIPLIAS